MFFLRQKPFEDVLRDTQRSRIWSNKTVYFRSVSTFLNSCMTQVLDLESTNLPTSRKTMEPLVLAWRMSLECSRWSNYGQSIECSGRTGRALGLIKNRLDTKVPGFQRMEVMGDESPRSHGSSNVDPKKNDHKIHGIKPFVVVVACPLHVDQFAQPY